MTYLPSFRLLSLLVILLVPVAGCDSVEPQDDGPGEEELITRVVLTLASGGQTLTATASDIDGDGSGFEISSIRLQAGATYAGTLAVFDDVNDVDIGAEVLAEAEAHQFFMIPQGGATNRITVIPTDSDANGLPLGLQFSLAVAAGNTATGTLQVVLSHYDTTPKDGVSRSGETDIDIAFPVTIR